jgi:hypothetical protein
MGEMLKYESLSQQDKASYKERLARYIGCLLAAVPVHLRQSVADRAAYLADRDDLSSSTPFVALPDNCPMPLASKIVSGMGATLCGLMSAAPGDSVDDVLEVADSVVTGVPITGDPAEHSLLPSAAAVLLDSAIRNGDHPDLRDPSVVEALVAIDQAYDCASHVLPLGGGLLDGIKSWWKGNFGTADEKLAYAAEKQEKEATKKAEKDAEARTKAITKLVKNGMTVAEATELVDSQPTASTGAEAGVDIDAQLKQDNGVQTSIGAATQSLTDVLTNAKNAMQATSSRLQSEKDTAEAASLKIARLKWAAAILDTPDEVAKLMVEVRPDYASQGGALQTAVDLLSSAKQSGEIPTLKVFSKLMGGLKKKSGDSSWLESLLSGDAARFYDEVTAPTDEKAAQGLADFLKIKSQLEDPFNGVPISERKEVVEL